MAFSLRDGVSWCLASGQAIFLDLHADRYSRLPADLEPAFLGWVSDADGALDGVAARRLVAAGVLSLGPGDAGRGPTAVAPASGDLLSPGSPRATVHDILAAAFAQARARRDLRRHRLVDLLSAIRARAQHASPIEPGRKAASITSAFDLSVLLMPKTDRCLPRALAAWSMCLRAGVKASLVFGVRVEPFAAHCWVQVGDAVLVGDHEQARLYTPILVAE
jgi:hypothetical protein